MKKTSVERALKYLRHNLDQGVWKPGDRLPNAKKIALLADVNHMSMLDALKILKNEKKVAYRERAGIFAGPIIPKQSKSKPALPAPGKKQKKKFEIIRDVLHNDIAIGSLCNHATMPSIKDLCVHYHADYTVIKKAIALLAADAIVQLEHKHYRIIRDVHPAATNTVYLFMHNIYQTNTLWHFNRDWGNIFIRTIETACHERHIRLVKKYYADSIQPEADLSNALGSIIFHSDNSNRIPAYQDSLDLITYVQKFNKPVVFVNPHSGNIKFPELIPAHKKEINTFFVSHQSMNEDAGHKVGRMLLSRGHKKVCFFAPVNMYMYTERYRGLCNFFSSAGLPDAVTCIMPDNDPPVQANTRNKNNVIKLKVMREHLKNDLAMGIIFSHELAVSDLISGVRRKMEQRYTDICSMEQELNIPSARLISDILECMIFAYKMELPISFKSPLVNHLHEIKNGITLQSRCFPLFEQALKIPDVTAWVCAEDHVTNSAALEFCKYHNIKIPEQIGLIGFQDHFESCINNISSYHFDFAKTALKAINLVLYPKHSARLFCKKGTGEFAFEGMVIDRGSV